MKLLFPILLLIAIAYSAVGAEPGVNTGAVTPADQADLEAVTNAGAN